MSNSIFVVEGAHDCSFVGHLLKDRGYVRAHTIDQVPKFWAPVIPNKYPVDDHGQLERVIRFPDIWTDPLGNTVGIAVAGGESRIIETLRGPLERLGVGNFSGIGVIVDADRQLSPPLRFQAVLQSLTKMNNEATDEGVPGFPIPLPSIPGSINNGPPKTGVFMFPDNMTQGLLESVLLDCARTNLPRIHKSAEALIRYLDKKMPHGHADMRKLRSASGKDKACAGIIANIVGPGSSLAVSLISGSWLSGTSRSNASVRSVDTFITSLL